MEESIATFDASDFRTCVLCLGYDDLDGSPHVVHASAVQPVDVVSLAHLAHMSKALRQVADQLDSMLREGKVPEGIELTASYEGEQVFRVKT